MEGNDAQPRPARLTSRKRRRWRKNLSRYSGYVLGRTLHAVVSRCPYALSPAITWLIGTFAYLLLGRDRRMALRNLTRVYGHERTRSAIRSLARGTFVSSARVYVEWAILRKWPLARLEREFPDACAALRKVESLAKAGGTGVVGLTAHLGNWELLSLFFSRFTPGFIVPVANRIYFQKYHDFIHRLRAGTGLDVIYNNQSARKAILALRQGHLLGLLPDQEVRTNSGVFVDFFGLPAYTAGFPVQLALRERARMTLILLVREGSTYKVIDRGLFDAPSTGDTAADIVAGTQLWTRMLEEEIRARPAQWTWMHNRWHSTPDRPRRHLDRSRQME